MNNLALTIIAAVVLMFLAIVGLAIGIILTGKSRLKRGCGYTPSRDKKRDTKTCSLCGNETSCEEKKDEYRA